MDNYLNIYRTLITQVEHEENAGVAGIKLNDIYEYMEVTLPVGKSMDEKKRQLRYLLNLLKDEGIVSREGMRWVFVMDTN